MTLQTIWTWVTLHQELTLLIVLGIFFNLAPRPHPENLKGIDKLFWTIIDRLCFLAAQEVPGQFKWVFTPSPSTKINAEPKAPNNGN